MGVFLSILRQCRNTFEPGRPYLFEPWPSASRFDEGRSSTLAFTGYFRSVGNLNLLAGRPSLLYTLTKGRGIPVPSPRDPGRVCQRLFDNSPSSGLRRLFISMLSVYGIV